MFASLAMVLAMNPVPATDEPKKEEPYPIKLTVRFFEKNGEERFLPLAGQKAKFRIDAKTGGMYWHFQIAPARRPLQKGDLLIEEDGTTWVVQKVAGGDTCLVEKKLTEKKP
jgi:hypothetical protein